MSKDDWDYVINTDLNNVFYCSRHVMDGMIEDLKGLSILLPLMCKKDSLDRRIIRRQKPAFTVLPNRWHWKLQSMVVTVNTVSPGYIGTNMLMAFAEDIREKIVAQIPVGLLGSIEEVAEAVSYLLSDKASFITGSNLSINGKHHMF